MHEVRVLLLCRFSSLPARNGLWHKLRTSGRHNGDVSWYEVEWWSQKRSTEALLFLRIRIHSNCLDLCLVLNGRRQQNSRRRLCMSAGGLGWHCEHRGWFYHRNLRKDSKNQCSSCSFIMGTVAQNLLPPDCPKCTKPVFYSNYVMHPDFQNNQRLWHRNCFSCDECGCPLQPEHFMEYRDKRSGRVYNCRRVCHHCSSDQCPEQGTQPGDGESKDIYCSYRCGPRKDCCEKGTKRPLSPCISDRVQHFEGHAGKRKYDGSPSRKKQATDPFSTRVKQWRPPVPIRPTFVNPATYGPEVNAVMPEEARPTIIPHYHVHSHTPVVASTSPTQMKTRYTPHAVSQSPPRPVRVINTSRPSCGQCGHPTYYNERVFSLRQPWHKECLYCCVCLKKLAPGQHAVKDGNPICHYPCMAVYYSSYQYAAGGKESRP